MAECSGGTTFLLRGNSGFSLSLQPRELGVRTDVLSGYSSAPALLMGTLSGNVTYPLVTSGRVFEHNLQVHGAFLAKNSGQTVDAYLNVTGTDASLGLKGPAAHIDFASGNAIDYHAKLQQVGTGLGIFTGGGAEAMRIDGSRNVSIGSAADAAGKLEVQTNSGLGDVVYIDANVGGLSGDIFIMPIRQRGSLEGAIFWNQATGLVEYQTFAGSHWSQPRSGQAIPPNLPIGTVLSTIDELVEMESADKSSVLPRVRVSNRSGDERVIGVFGGHSPVSGVGLVAALGVGKVRVTGPVSGGQLLCSLGDGTAMPQGDNVIRSYTIGKVTVGRPNANSGEVHLRPCVLYCG